MSEARSSSGIGSGGRSSALPLRCTPITRSGTTLPSSADTPEPMSPPCAANRSYPSRDASSAQARAIRPTPHPVAAGLPLKPYPGSDGTTTWNASSGSGGSVSGRSVASNSRNEPGQPWVISSGVAAAGGDRTCRAWIGSPSIVVTTCGIALSLACVAGQS